LWESWKLDQIIRGRGGRRQTERFWKGKYSMRSKLREVIQDREKIMGKQRYVLKRRSNHRAE
jgi:hypothetical protein